MSSTHETNFLYTGEPSTRFFRLADEEMFPARKVFFIELGQVWVIRSNQLAIPLAVSPTTLLSMFIAGDLIEIDPPAQDAQVIRSYQPIKEQV